VAINFISRFYALFLPSALGPEAIRWYKVTKNKQGKSFFLASTMVERLFFLLILLVFGTLPLLFHTENQQILTLKDRLLPLITIAYIVIGGTLVYFLNPRLQMISNRLFKKTVPIKRNSKIDQFIKNFSIKDISLSLIGALVILSLFWQLFFLVRMYFLFSAMSLPFSFIDVSWMGSLVLLLQVLPVSFAGIGVRESAYAYLFSLFGLPPEKGVLIGILFFTQMLIFSCIGAVLNFFEQ